MSIRVDKTSTDLHWNARPGTVDDRRRVNFGDLGQRRLENAFIFFHLKPTDRLLEVGCGNGYLTDLVRSRVAHVDSFDFAENMIEAAKKLTGEINNRFFVDSILAGKNVAPPYDAALCVRVLINLANLEEQKAALANLASWLKPGGRLILIEGFLEGFEALNALRKQCGVEEFKPAKINFYSHFPDLQPEMERHFKVAHEWHSGMFDILTRVAKPMVEAGGADGALAQFNEQIAPLVLALNPDIFKQYARARGFVLERR